MGIYRCIYLYINLYFPEINMFQMRAYRAKKSESGPKARIWNMLISINDCMDDH